MLDGNRNCIFNVHCNFFSFVEKDFFKTFMVLSIPIQYEQFSKRPLDGTLTDPTTPSQCEPRVMAMKGFSTLPRSPISTLGAV